MHGQMVDIFLDNRMKAWFNVSGKVTETTAVMNRDTPALYISSWIYSGVLHVIQGL